MPTPAIENMLKRELGYNRLNIAEFVHDWMCVSDIHNKYPGLVDDLTQFARDYVSREQIRRSRTTYSIIIEEVRRPALVGYRAITFETNWMGTSIINNIFEAETTQRLFKLVKSKCDVFDEITHVQDVDYPVSNPWAAAVALIRKHEE